jgi:hypothetical protein
VECDGGSLDEAYISYLVFSFPRTNGNVIISHRILRRIRMAHRHQEMTDTRREEELGVPKSDISVFFVPYLCSLQFLKVVKAKVVDFFSILI